MPSATARGIKLFPRWSHRIQPASLALGIPYFTRIQPTRFPGRKTTYLDHQVHPSPWQLVPGHHKASLCRRLLPSQKERGVPRKDMSCIFQLYLVLQRDCSRPVAPTPGQLEPHRQLRQARPKHRAQTANTPEGSRRSRVFSFQSTRRAGCLGSCC